MGWKEISGIVLIFLIIIFLIIYWFVPFQDIELNLEPTNSNFSVTNYSKMQFYENMRYPSNKISYKIYDCPLSKKSNMEEAFSILEGLTILDFYSVESGEEISVTCDDTTKVEEGLFIAGEGGPTNITIAGNFNVIHAGKILLIRESECVTPNVALHELLHALGFDHSENKNNIMYEVSNCKQTIGDDIAMSINTLYSIEALPDLAFEEVNISLNGKYLDANLSVRNNGLKYSQEAKIIIYADDKEIKQVELGPLDIGYGRKISLSNVWITKINIHQIKFVIDANFVEIDKSNNEIVFVNE